MATNTHRLGQCSFCEASIDDRQLLIAYERAGEPAAYAECPDCRDVVSLRLQS
jgi:hypothetical protein